MWNWISRRKHFRRDEDLRLRMEKAIEEKHKVSVDALEKLRQYAIDRREHLVSIDFSERRKA